MYKIIAGIILGVVLKVAMNFGLISKDTFLIVFSIIFILVGFGLDEVTKPRK